ncbi:MAG: hypothetical protein MRY83_17600, partial [Flavobacteriales bacterium]|nr:hypothetical protein [Flavobacteriales bacterium]
MRTHYDFYKALKNPKTPKDLCIFLSEIKDFSDLEHLDKFINVTKLSILDGKKLKRIPDAVW